MGNLIRCTLAWSGFALIAFSLALDKLMRMRMTLAGRRNSLFALHFRYSEYIDEAKKRGWPLWPPRFIFLIFWAGFVLFVVGGLTCVW